MWAKEKTMWAKQKRRGPGGGTETGTARTLKAETDRRRRPQGRKEECELTELNTERYRSDAESRAERSREGPNLRDEGCGAGGGGQSRAVQSTGQARIA
jgi:hypothetical protein